MSLRAGRIDPTPRERGGRPQRRPDRPGGADKLRHSFRWWVAPSPALVWKLPLLLAVAAFSLVYAFRGLVRMAFIFDANPILSFVFAPLLLPLMALPAICLMSVIWLLPRLWQSEGVSDERKFALALLALPAALLLAAFVDLVEIITILRLGIRLPRLPFDPF